MRFSSSRGVVRPGRGMFTPRWRLTRALDAWDRELFRRTARAHSPLDEWESDVRHVRRPDQ